MSNLLFPLPEGTDPIDCCEVCADFWKLAPPLRMTSWSEWEAHLKAVHVSKPKKIFAFTLTTNGDDKAEEEEKLTVAATKLFHQESVPVAKGEAYLEYTEAGRPHIHGWYETVDGGRVFSKVFKRCWPLWGEKSGKKQFAGGYHEEMKTNRYIGYASAEGRLVVKK